MMKKEQLEILVAEPLAEMRSFIQACLKNEGYNNIRITENGRSAWIKIKNSPVDLIIANFELPQVNGLTLLTEVRRDTGP